MTARAGRFAYDTMTLIGPGHLGGGTGAAVDAALSGGRSRARAASAAAYACCRPPGHHATRGAFGGSCYLNNAAVAAARLRDAGRGPVAVIDIDAHHGNGTQSIFYAEAEVLTGSVHVDPGRRLVPPLPRLRRRDRRGRGRGRQPQPAAGPRHRRRGHGSKRSGELAALGARRRRRSLVVALGVDAAAGDPESPLEVTADGYREAGRILGALGLPTVLVQEGGYDLKTLGALVVETLRGFEHSR